jgi:hypothetical protein
MARVHNPALRQAFLRIVRNQLRSGKPTETKATLERLMAEGYSRDHSMKLIAAVVATEIVRSKRLAILQPCKLCRSCRLTKINGAATSRWASRERQRPEFCHGISRMKHG